MEEPTLTEALAAAGYSHREPEGAGRSNYKREIVRVSDGEVVASLTAHEAWAWLKEKGIS